MPGEVKEQLVMLGRSKPPNVATGKHCTAPYECPFYERCHEAAEGVGRAAGEVVIKPGLKAALARIKGPVAHLDFETG